MKISKYIGIGALATIIGLGVILSSCSSDSLGDSIFDTNDYPLDKTSYTFPLDSFCKANFQEPYNLQFLYKMKDISSDMDYNLVPCTYEKGLDLAVLSKYLWFDVYRDNVGNGDLFLKKYSPKIIHIIGSKAYNPGSGTERLGLAEGGLKITLYNANDVDVKDIDYINEYFFKTMHHEFSHILNQNINRPTDFDLISNGKYNAEDWGDTPDSVALGRGFVSPYASKQAGEDWVEVIANYIVKDTVKWNQMLNTAAYEWEYVEDVDYDYWKSLNTKVYQGLANVDSVGYLVGVNSNIAFVVRKSIQRDAENKYAVLSADSSIVYKHSSGVNGRQVILQKLEMVKSWLKEFFDYDIDKVRMAVQRKQWLTDENGNFILDSKGRFINNFTYKRTDGTTLMDELRQQVTRLKENPNPEPPRAE
ncbi:MAG: putative zinc-binding metallopeptidase [Prevotellaceae bacterium]|nr:putative zinc-binding metallopeptidase [Prevotellaceae bacterium]